MQILRDRRIERRPPTGSLIAEQITAMVITFNEAPNIRRCLDRLTWAKRILLIDSGSTDGTLEIVGSYPQVDVVHRPFDDFATQCNFGLAQVSSDWVLSLDADYELSEQLVAEIESLNDDGTAGYSAAFTYRVYGRALRASLYPPRTILYRREAATYRNEGHGHRVSVTGRIATLKGKINLDDRKPLSRWFASQRKYAELEAIYLLSSPRSDLNRNDRIRLMGYPAPVLVFLYVLIAKRGILDGWHGWFYVLQRTLAETILALEIVERRLRSYEDTER